MRFELFVALRYLFAKREHAFISVSSWVTVLGVGIGVAALIIIMGVMNGFTEDLRDKIIGVNSHGIIFSKMGPLSEDTEALETIRSVPGVKGATPFIYSELMASSSRGGKGIVLRGIDPDSAPKTLGVLNKLVSGSVAALKDNSPIPGIIIGKDLASRLGLSIGSRINLLSPTGQQSSAGFTPRIRAFRVVGIFSIGMFEFDSSFVFTSLDGAREILGRPDKSLTGIELAFDDVYKAQQLSDEVIAKIGPEYYAQTWMTMNANLFAALELEKYAMALILGVVVIVGAFSIISSLFMLVMEKTRDIAVLMSIGATRSDIRRIFTFQGLLIGGMGTLFGFVSGLILCYLLQQYQFIKLPHGVYSLDYLPVLLKWHELVIIAAGSMVICFVMSIYPAYKAAGLEPVEALRHE